MHTVEDLLTIQRMPRESEISLQVIQQFYKKYLCDRIYVYQLASGEEVRFAFKEDNLCHLLGIQHILKPYRFQGQSGYDLLADGTVTIQFLKQKNKQGYKSKKHRILYFPFLYQLVLAPILIQSESEGQSGNMQYELIVYNQVDCKYLHLGLRKKEDRDFYYPVSFFEDGRDRYVSGQPVRLVHTVHVDQDVVVSKHI